MLNATLWCRGKIATIVVYLTFGCIANGQTAHSEIFSSTSPWRKMIGSSVSNQQSHAIIDALKQKRPEGLTINTDAWTPAVVYADESDPRRDFSWSIWTMPSVPTTSSLFSAALYFAKTGDTDASVCLIDQKRRINYSLYGLRRDQKTNALSISAGAAFRNDGSGWWSNITQPWAGRASGGSLCGGLVLASELSKGVVRHALAVGWPRSLILKRGPVFPATTSDGTCTDPSYCVAMGSRIQLDPELSTADLRVMGLTAGDINIAKALQNYGAYVVDSSGTFSLYVENGFGSGHAKYGLSKRWPSVLFDHLSVLANPPTGQLESLSSMGQYVRRREAKGI